MPGWWTSLQRWHWCMGSCSTLEVLCNDALYKYMFTWSHTHTVVRECCKGDDASQWRNPNFDPPPRSNPISDSHKSWQRWLRCGALHLCKSLLQNCHRPLCTAKRLSYDIASISETTTSIDKKFQDNICKTKMCPAMQYCDVITNPKWQTAAILKIAYSPYLREKSSDFDKIWYTTADMNPMTVTWPEIEIFESQDGAAAILKIAFLAITHRPILRFQQNFVWGSRMACRQGLDDKNCNVLKFTIADGRHFKNS